MNIESLLASLRDATNVVLTPALNLIFALLLLLVGLLAARGLSFLTAFLFKVVQLDKAVKQTGFNSLVEKGGIKKSASELLGDLVYWIVVLIVVIAVGSMFGLAAEPVLARVFNYVGIVFLASLILGLGIFLAGLVSAIVRLIMINLGLEGARTASRIIYYIVIIFTFLFALAELGFKPDWTPHIGVILGAPALAAAIAFGLGCKDMAADFLANLFKGK